MLRRPQLGPLAYCQSSCRQADTEEPKGCLGRGRRSPLATGAERQASMSFVSHLGYSRGRQRFTCVASLASGRHELGETLVADFADLTIDDSAVPVQGDGDL
jgi:hypothetical protein